jgi:tetratricopeptide (TPR) repeat protein
MTWKIAGAGMMILLTLACAGACLPVHEGAAALAKGHFDKATADPAEKNFKQGMHLVKEGNYEAAIDSFQQAAYFSRNQYNPEAFKFMGLCYKALRQYPKAIEAFNRCLSQTTEKQPDVYIDLAESYMEQQEWDKARRAIDKAYEEQDTEGDWRQKFAMGELQEKLAAVSNEGNLGEALSFYDVAIREKPHYTEAWMAKARVMVKLERYNDAIAAYRHILESGPLMHPDLVELYFGMGTCFYKRGDHQGALDHWRLALERNPDAYEPHLSLANMLFDEKHYSAAQKEYEAALRTMPPYADAAKQRDAINRRLVWIEQASKPKDAPIVIKPSPSMRQQYEEATRVRDPLNNAPVGKDAGF